jgi:hypothetical protein
MHRHRARSKLAATLILWARSRLERRIVNERSSVRLDTGARPTVPRSEHQAPIRRDESAPDAVTP